MYINILYVIRYYILGCLLYLKSIVIEINSEISYSVIKIEKIKKIF